MMQAILRLLPETGKYPIYIRPMPLLLLLLLLTSGLFAQVSVRGKVTDESGSGLPGVNILIKGTTTGTTSDANGEYVVEIPANAQQAILIFSFIGYETQEQAVNGRSVINVNMAVSAFTLGEVVVVGYGTQRKADVTGSLVSLSSDALREVPVANLQQALQGRMAGVEVQRIGTAPGATARIRIRGERSVLGSNDPLIVLDGIPFEGNLNDINPDEIASINVLKDASATAIYGSRGANGVMLITTKRGQAGETTLSFSSYIGVTTVARKYPLFNAEEYQAMRDYTGVWPYRPEEVEGIALGRDVDWQELMYENGYITNHNLTVTGGTEKGSYSVSGGYFKETTILPEQDFERFTLRVSTDSKIGERVKIGVTSLNSVNYANGTQFVNPQPGNPGAFGGGIMYNILATSPLMPPYSDNGEIFPEPFGNLDDASANLSPLYIKRNNSDWVDRVRRLRTFNSLYAEVKILEGLTYRFNLGLEYGQTNSAQFQGKGTYFRKLVENRASVRNTENYSWTAENILTYEKTFAEDHRLTFTGLYSAQQSRSFATQATKDAITANFIEFYDMSQANPAIAPILGGGEQTWGLLSYMGRVNYAFKDRYLFTATFRRDGSSRLATKWNNYPAFAVAWNAINEPFIQDVNFLSNLKVRVGYGQTSNQSVAPYTTLGGVVNTVGIAGGTVPLRYNYGPTQVSGYIAARIPDKTLDWEYTNTLNIGLDFGLFEDRLTGSIDWYDAQTTNLLFNLRLPISSGYEQEFQTNIGGMENKGVEIVLSGKPLKLSNGFTWDIDLNWYLNRNKLLKYLPGVTQNIGDGLFVGQPITAIYDYEKIGIWQLGEDAAAYGQQPGQIKFRDVDNNGVIDAEDRKIIGNQQADWQGGITNRFTWKGFDMSFVVYIRQGGTLLSYLHAPNGAYLTNLTGQRSGLKVDYWTPDNPTNEFPAPGAALPGGASTGWTTLAYYDASFARVRAINLGYNIPKSLASRIKAQNARVYFTAQNPFLLWSPYVFKHNGVDPEPTGQGGTGIVATGGNFRTGGNNPALVISASTPPTRSFIVGLNLTF
ncbi:MAG TPA: TonB-dependent receptor [Cyclobacteriaceae bacterium]|nr:TonB-dependent receptor [Cyclobacteriaceae bacterium]HRJ83201.1 TonB-dependent receptor [Cyclobacteriaceae bacterium]